MELSLYSMVQIDIIKHTLHIHNTQTHTHTQSRLTTSLHPSPYCMTFLFGAFQQQHYVYTLLAGSFHATERRRFAQVAAAAAVLRYLFFHFLLLFLVALLLLESEHRLEVSARQSTV